MRQAPASTKKRTARATPRRAPPAAARNAPALSPVGVAACLLLAAPAGFAAPQGAVLVSGQATVRQTAPGQMDIQQSTPKAQLDWTSFSIAAGERVNVVQPDRTSVLLNRVVGDNPSLIYGSLQSNGSVWLINPRGIVFGASSRVDVGSLVASTLAITQDDLASGRIQLGAGAGGAGELRSEGRINAADGSVILVSPQLVHTGQITARRVGLAAASEVLVDVEGDGLIFFNVKNDKLDARLQLLGSVRADGGTAEIRAAARAGFADTVLNMDGVVQARSLGQREGRIVVDGGSHGVTRVAGTLDASGAEAGTQGGHITVQGAQVLVDSTARLDASGAAGGGSLRVGGGWQGGDRDMANATTVTVNHGALLAADATQRGDGGRISVWADDTTRFEGHASARGGADGGNGGAVETSGKHRLGLLRGSVDTGAPAGNAGLWLLDPDIIEVRTPTGAETDAGYPGVNGGGAGDTFIVAPATLQGVSASTVSLVATNRISFLEDLALGNGHGLSAQANIIELKANVSTTNSPISFTVTGAGGRITQDTGKTVNAGSSTLSLDGNGGNITLAGTLTTSNTSANNGVVNGAILIRSAADLQLGNVATGGDNGTITLNFSGAGTQANLTQIGAGKLVKTGAGTLTLSNANGYAGGTEVNSGTLVMTGSGTAGGGAINLGANRLDVGGGASVGNAITLANGATLGAGTGGGTLTGGALTVGDGETLNLSANGGTLTVDRVIGGASGAVGVAGDDVVALKATNTYGGGTVLGGTVTLRIDGNQASAGGGSINVGNRTLDLRNGASVGNGIVLGNGATLTSSSGGGTLTGSALSIGNSDTLNLSAFGGTLSVERVIGGSNPQSKVVAAGTGTVALKRDNTYEGGTTVNGGTLSIDGVQATAGTGEIALDNHTLSIAGGATVANDITVATGATITAAGNTGGTLGTGAGTGALALGSGVGLNLAASGTGALIVDRAITDTSNNGTVTITGGTVVLKADGTYGGDTTVSGGTLRIDGGRAGDAGRIVLQGTTLDIASGSSVDTAISADTGARISGAGTLAAGSLILADGAELQLSGSGGTLTVARAIPDTAGAGLESVKVTGGTVVLTGTSAYTGTTTVNSGATLQLGADSTGGVIGNGAIALDPGATLRIQHSNTVTLANVISGGTGILEQAGVGTTKLTGNNSYGATTISKGVLQVGDNDGSGSLGSGAVAIGSNGTLRIDRTDALALGNTLSGSGAFDQHGSGSTVLTADSSAGFSGAVNVTGGTLVISGAGAKAGTGTITLGTHVLDIVGGASVANTVVLSSGASITSNSDVGGGTLAAGTLTMADGAALNLAGTGGALTMARAIPVAAGAGLESVNVTGGNVRFTGSNGYGGATAISAGATLTVGAGDTSGTLGGGAVSIAGGGTLRIDRSDTLTLALGNVLSGSGTLDQHGNGGTVLRADSSAAYTGAVTVTGGTLGISGSTANAGTGSIALGTHVLDIANGASVANTLSLATGALITSSGGTGTLAAGTLTMADGTSLKLSGSGGTLTVARDIPAVAGAALESVNVTGGTVVLTGTSTYTGTTTIDSGATLSLGAGGTVGAIAGGDIAIAGTGALRIDRSDTLNLSNTLSGGGSLVQAGSGTTVLTGSNANTHGATTISAGVLQLGNNDATGSLGSGAISVASGATLRIQRSDTLTLANAISGAGSLAQAGTGTTILGAGTNSYGATAVSNGVLQVGDNDGSGSLGSGTITVGGSGTLRIDRTDALTLANTLSGTGTLDQHGTGSTVLTGDSSAGYSGAINVTGGTLAISGTGAKAGTGTIALGNHTLDIRGGATVGNAITVTGGATITSSGGVGTLGGAGALNLGTGVGLTLSGSGGTLAVSRAISDTDNTGTVMIGGGTVVLMAANTYGGGTTVSAGTLRIDGGSAGDGAIALGNRTLDIVNGSSVASAITASSGATISSSSNNGTLAVGTLTLADGAVLNLAGGSGNSTLTVLRTIPEVAGGSAESVNINGGIVSLRAANSYTGDTTVSAGTLRIDGGSAGDGAIVLGANTLDIVNASSVASAISASSGATVSSSTGGGTLAAGTLTLADGATLNLAGGAASTLTVARAITATAGAGAESVNVGSGTVVLTGSNTYGGSTAIANGATLVLGTGGSAGTLAGGAVTIASGGVLRIDHNDTLTLANVVGGAGSLEQVGAGTTVLTADNAYGSTLVSAGVLQVGAGGSTGTLGTGGITVNNPGALRFNRAGTLTVPGSITGSGRLELAGSGVAELVANGLYTGGTSILSGTLRIVGATASAGTGTIAIGTGTLDISGNARVDNVVTIGGGGSITNSSGLGTLGGNATPLLLANGSTLSLSSTGAGLTLQRVVTDDVGTASVLVGGTGSVTLAAASSYDGGTRVASGTLVAGVDAALAAGSSLIVDSGGSFDIGTHNVSVGGVSLRGGNITGTSGVLSSSTDHDLRAGSVSAILGGSVGLVKSTGGAVTISGSQAYTGATNVNAGTLALGADNVLPNSTVIINGGTLELGTHVDTVGALSLLAGALNGSGGTLTAATYSLAGGTVAGNLGAGALTVTGDVLLSGTAAASTVNVDSGTLTLGSAERLANNAALRVLAPATLALSGTETVGSVDLRGTLTGNGTLVATGSTTLTGGHTLVGANLGGATLSSSGTSTLGGTAAAGTVTVTGGVLLLDGTQRLASGATVNVNAGSLQLAGAQTVQTLNLSGVLDGVGQTLTVTDHATLNTGASVVANLAGARADVAGDTALGGSATVAALNVNGGTLTLASGGRLGAATDVAVAGPATLALGGDEAVRSLALTGALAGNGTLTAGQYTLNTGASTGATANLGAGTLTINGNATLAGTAAAGTVNIDGGTLLLAAAQRLSGAATVNVNAGGLQLSDAQTVQTLNLSGTLAGSGQTLTTTDRATLRSGASVLTNLAGPRLDVRGNATLTGTAAATSVNLITGKLTLASGGRLAAGADMALAAGTELALGGNESVNSFTAAGTLSGGAAILTAPRYTLQEGAVVAARLGAGQLDVAAGDTLGATLSAGSGAATVNVNTGTLRLSQGNLLADNANVTVASGATLTLNGDDTVGALAASGTVNGIGILNAGTYLLTEGNYDLDIGSGAITSRGRSRLNGSVGAALVTVEDGVLTLGSAGRFTNAPLVDIHGSGTLNLGGNETFGALAGAGILDLRGATLTTGGLGDSTFTGTLQSSVGAGSLVKVGGTSFTFSGTGSYTGLTRVTEGTFNATGTLASATVQVGGAVLNLVGAERLADGATVNVAAAGTLNLDSSERVGTLNLLGHLGGGGTLTATNYLLDSALVDANLGGGQMVSTGSSRINGRAALDALTVGGGTLLLGGSQQLSAPTAVTLAGTATLQLGGDQTLGSLAGGGGVTLGSHTLTTGAGGDSSYGGVIAGDGGLVKQGGSSFTLTGSNTYLGGTRVAAGTLVLGAAERLADSGAVTVDTGATLELRGDERVGSLALSGTLAGSGHTLSASSTVLDSGTVNALLGSGSLVSRGASTLNGTAQSGSVTIEGGTLTLAGDNRLSALPALTVNATGRLLLGGDQALGTLAGTGNVDIASHTLGTGGGGDSHFGGTLVGSGSLVKQGGSTFTLDGTSSAATVQVSAGTLALGAADRLADTTAVDVANGAALTLAGNDRIASLTLAGTLGGSGTLSAATYALNAGRVDADLGAGVLNSRGSSRINGSVAAAVNVVDGTLTLGASNRLADDAAVAVARDATLSLDGTDTVGSLALAGTLAGSGTLTAANTTLNGGTVTANLGGGALVTRGSSLLSGLAASSSVTVETGTLTLGSADRLTGMPALQINRSASVALRGDQTLGTLSGQGELSLSNFSVATGSGGDSTFAGVISGFGGGLIKQGAASTFTLTGANLYTGSTRVAAGTLRVGDGATAGSLSSSRFDVDGVLSFARSDSIVLAQEVNGTGSVEQAGAGRLTFSGGNKRYSGSTLVTRGELATAASGDLSGASTVNVAAGARLLLAGNEAVRGIDADGSVALQAAAGASLAATDSLLMRGAVTSAGDLALSAGQRVLAGSADNRFGGTVALSAGGRIDLNSGIENGKARALTLGALTAGAGGHIDAGATTLAGDASINGGTLELASAAEQGAVALEGDRAGRQITGLPIAFAADGVAQGNAGRISVAAGAGLSITTTNGASVQLLRSGNSFLGELSVVTGTPNVAWTPNSTNVAVGGGAAQNYAVQSRVRVEGTTVNVGGAGIVADVVQIRADRLATVGDSATIVARMPFDASVGTAVSLPALTLELTPEAFNQSFPFGEVGRGLRVDVGSQAYGNRTLPLNAGYITVLPRNGARGSTAVLLTGPAVGNYRFFFEGAGVQTEIPVFYNGVLPATPQVQNSISATLAVSEGARKDRFEEAVRTENVAVRLRAGVIAEVGPAPSATQGTEGIRVPLVCPPAAGLLQCGAP